MELILLRHGKAEDSHPDGGMARELTEKGHDQAIAQAARLKQADALPNLVLTSPYTRARQTAETFCAAAGIPGPIVHSWIGCGMAPETALEEILGYNEFPRIAIVGHEPDLSNLISHLLGARAGAIKVRKGSIACLKISPPSRGGVLQYLVPPSLEA